METATNDSKAVWTLPIARLPALAVRFDSICAAWRTGSARPTRRTTNATGSGTIDGRTAAAVVDSAEGPVHGDPPDGVRADGADDEAAAGGCGIRYVAIAGATVAPAAVVVADDDDGDVDDAAKVKQMSRSDKIPIYATIEGAANEAHKQKNKTTVGRRLGKTWWPAQPNAAAADR